MKEDAKSHIFDLENFSASYAYSDVKETGFYKADYLYQSFRGNLSYNYNPEPVLVEPFKNIGFLQSPWFALIRDFNISLLPSNLSFRGDLDRRFVKTQLRNSDLTTEGIAPTYEKYFTFNRSYNLRWNLSKNLAVDYMARANAIIDEPEGDINTDVKRDSIWSNIKRLGRMKNFTQNISGNYRVPFDKIPVTDWINADAQYSVGYTWQAGTLNQLDADSIPFGNEIRNNRERGLNGKIDFVKLYNKVKLLKDINTPSRGRSPRRQTSDTVEQKPDLKLLKGALRTLMALRSINFRYSMREGTILPGFMREPSLFGMDSSFSSPGWAFIFGSQNPDIRKHAAKNDWLTKSQYVTAPFTQINSSDLNLQANVEPFNDLRIQIDVNKRRKDSYQEIFRRDSLFRDVTESGYGSLTPSRIGDYSVSFLPIKTAFIGDIADNKSPVFEDFNLYRNVIKRRLDQMNPNGEYKAKAQDVLIPAFLAAYTGQDPENVKLTPFPKFPFPNWRIDYKGLTNIEPLSEVFSSISLTHNYQSSYSITGYTSSLEFVDDPNYNQSLELNNSIENYPLARMNQAGEELTPLYIMNQVIITERFSPLVGLNFSTRSRLQARVEYRKERNIALNMMNSQVTELSNKDFSFSFGFTKANLKLPFKVQGQTIVLENDLTFKLDFTVRDTKTIQRKIVEDSLGVATDNIITSGNVNFQFRPTVNYVLNQRLNISFYFERNINEPRITSSYPRRTSAFGTQVRFSLSQ